MSDSIVAKKPIKVFISYKHESEKVTKIINALSEILNKYGFDCITDMDSLNPEDGWNKWMEDGISDAHYVLIMCTKSYHEGVAGKVKEKKGIFYEFQVIRNRIQSQGKQNWCIPLILKQDDIEYVPIILKSAVICNLEKRENLEILFRILKKGCASGSSLNPEEFAKELVDEIKKIKNQSQGGQPSISTKVPDTGIINPPDIRKHYVAFDLGSDSMAACYRFYKSNETGYIFLQEFADVLMGVNEDEIDYLKSENKSNKKSPWLRNLISIQDKRQDYELDDSHLNLQFIDEKGQPLLVDEKKVYESSLFGYFFKKNEAFTRKILPNPKIHFMKGAAEIIPEVELKSGSGKKYNSETLIHHMLTQVLQNFVLKSTAFRNKNKYDEDKNLENLLILSIPNVCGLSRAKNIQDFLKDKTGFDEVEMLFESDAASFYFFDRNEQTEKFRKFLDQINSDKIDNYQVLTFDIGHGTTDISLIKVFCQRNAGEDHNIKKFIVKARTGRTDGGSRLSYLLATYFNDCLKEIYNKKEFKNLNKPAFDFINGTGEKDIQGPVLESLEKFIKILKTKINKDYKIELKKKEQSIFIKEIAQKWPSANISDLKLKEKLDKTFCKHFYLSQLPGGRLWRFLYKKFPLIFTSHIKRKIKLREDIENYVKENTSELLGNLGNFAIENEGKEAAYDGVPPKTFAEMIKATPTFVIIAGQASQFKPIQNSIEKELKKLNIGDNFDFLPGEKAKKACLWGSIICKFLQYTWEKPDDIHGTIGFFDEDPSSDEPFKIINMVEFNKEKKCRIPFKNLSTYDFFYSTRPPNFFSKKRLPDFKDGTTFLIDRFQPDKPIFDVEYDDKKKELVVNGTHVDIISYGGNLNDYKTDKSIFRKVWPAFLDPAAISWGD